MKKIINGQNLLRWGFLAKSHVSNSGSILSKKRCQGKVDNRKLFP